MSDDKNIIQENISEAAKRALAEAEARRADQEKKEASLAAQREGEKGGPKKKEPVRYGDWERDGRAFDF
ncbi:MAG: DUF1674 domain-containing protein [Pseudomonadota bacterium]